ncbi:MAG: type VI secretion system baseplate subunit TssE [Gammaproteobacteria bacterium]
MAELTPQERLQPSLLDRLTDDDATHQVESREQRVLSMRRLRELVLRDLGWLFNTTNLQVAQDLSDFPQVQHSVLNYGVPEFTGHTISSMDISHVERRIQEAIRQFEPRILPNTLRVHVAVDEEEMSHSALSFEIIGELWARPMPQQLYLKTEIDLELGDVHVYESGR